MKYKNLGEILCDYAKVTGKSYVWYDAKGIRRLEDAGDTDKLNQVYAFYREFLDELLYEEFFHSSYGMLEYSNDVAAQDAAEDWFPREAQVPDADYYVYACAFNESGAIVWENVPVQTPPASEEDAE